MQATQATNEISPRVALGMAEDALLADTDQFCDWLGAQCIGFSNVNVRYVSSHIDPSEFVTDLTVPQLVAASMYPRSSLRAAAMTELSDRFVKEHAPLLARMAETIMTECAE